MGNNIPNFMCLFTTFETYKLSREYLPELCFTYRSTVVSFVAIRPYTNKDYNSTGVAYIGREHAGARLPRLSEPMVVCRPRLL